MDQKESGIVTALWRGELFALMDLISTLHIGVIEERGHIWKVRICNV